MKYFLAFMEWLSGILGTPTRPPEPVEPEPAPIPSYASLIAKQSVSWLGIDASPLNLAPEELSCAEGVSNILRTIYPDFTYTISTIELASLLKKSPYFKATLTPSAGCVVVSPRNGATAGHCGIFITDDQIASNDSQSGLWQQNYTWAGWIAFFKDVRKLPHTYLYEPI